MKKNVFLFLLAIIYSNVVFAQKTSNMEYVFSDGSVAKYSTVSNSLEGLFEIVSPFSSLYAKGVYEHNKRIGTWYFYNKDKSLFMRYNYDTNTASEVNKNAIAYADIKVYADNEEDSKKASIPLPLSSLDQYFGILCKTALMKMDFKNRPKGDFVMVITVNIDEKGNPTFISKYDYKDISIEQKFVLTEEKFQTQWIPATLNGKNYKSSFSSKFVMNFNILNTGNDAPTHRRIYW